MQLRSSGSHPPKAPPGPDAETRLAWVDVAKGIGILLVVIGHTIRGLMAAGIAPADGAAAVIDRVIYGFHMPLFFLLAGLFLLPRASTTFGGSVRRALARLAYPYIVWATLQTLLQVVMSRHTNHPAALSWSLLWSPPMQFWFLYALLLQALWFALCGALGLSRPAIVLVSLALWATEGLMPLGWGVLHQARANLFFTAIGVAAGSKMTLAAIGSTPPRSLVVAVVVGYVVLVAMLRIDATDAAGASPREAFTAAAGTLATIAVAVLVARGQPQGVMAALQRALTRCGAISLAIFAAHTIASSATRIVLQRGWHIDHAGVHVIAGTTAGVLLPLALVALTHRWGVRYVFSWPERQANPRMG